ncbi:MAG: response regulator [Oscillospiraceae bacterium]|nr:response regulator [Oscillospiraceae bacterium]
MKKQVLIADANEQFRSELVTILKDSEEFEVMGVAADGEEALQIASESRPDIIILDLLLPQYDGISVLDLISVRYTDCKAFVATGFISNYIISALAARRVSALLKKPCSAQCVVDRINEVLQEIDIPLEDKIPDLQQRITAMIHAIGVPANIKGYRYLREAIKLAVEDLDRINNMTEYIYKPIALADNSTPKRVRTAIMRAIEIAWDRGDLDTLQSFFGYTVSNIKGKPTNSEFIAILADKLSLWIKAHTDIM